MFSPLHWFLKIVKGSFQLISKKVVRNWTFCILWARLFIISLPPPPSPSLMPLSPPPSPPPPLLLSSPPPHCHHRHHHHNNHNHHHHHQHVCLRLGTTFPRIPSLMQFWFRVCPWEEFMQDLENNSDNCQLWCLERYQVFPFAFLCFSHPCEKNMHQLALGHRGRMRDMRSRATRADS